MIVADAEAKYAAVHGDSDDVLADLEFVTRSLLQKTYDHYGKGAADYIAVMLSKMLAFAFQKFEEENDIRLDLGDPEEAAKDLAQAIQKAREAQMREEEDED